MPEPNEGRAVQRYRYRPDTVATDRGDGPPVVFCHGTFMDRTMFDPQVQALSDDYRVVAYDTRARTDQYADRYNLYDLADDCAALLDAKGIDSCVLGGMSMGGFMALRFAERYPERLAGLICIDTSADPHSRDEIEQYGEMLEAARDAGGMLDEQVEIITQLLFGATTLQDDPDLAQKWVNRWVTYPGEAVYQEVSSWLERPDFTENLEDIDLPALVIHGEEDLGLEPARSDSLVEHLDARRVMIPEAGHTSNLENPGPVNDAIGEFLEEVY